jgi:hypothetical protein
VLAAHLKGEVHIGLYPLLNGDKCRWLAADFDGLEAIVDALMYVKASRKLEVPVAVELAGPRALPAAVGEFLPGGGAPVALDRVQAPAQAAGDLPQPAPLSPQAVDQLGMTPEKEARSLASRGLEAAVAASAPGVAAAPV